MKIWKGMCCIGAALLLGACSFGGGDAETEVYPGGIFYSDNMTLTVDGADCPVYEVGGRAAVAIEDILTHGFSADTDTVEKSSGDKQQLLLLSKTGENENTEEAVQFLDGKDVGDITVYINGNYIELYESDGKLCALLDVIGNAYNSTLRDSGVSEAYMASSYNGEDNSAVLDTEYDRLPKADDTIEEFKAKDPIFTQEIVREIENDDFTIVQKNIYYDFYKTREEVLKVDKEGRAFYIGSVFSDLYGISAVDDLEFDGEKLRFSGIRNGERGWYAADIDTGKPEECLPHTSYEQKVSELSPMWQAETDRGGLFVIEENGRQRIILIDREGFTHYISRDITAGKEFSQITDIELTEEGLRFSGDSEEYLVDTETGGVIGDTIYSDPSTIILDGVHIQSYEIGGKKAIRAEDLVNCGFNIVSDDQGINLVEQEIAESRTDCAGLGRTEIGRAQKTKSRVRFNGMTIPSLECGGSHYLLIDDLCGFRTEYNSEWGYSDYNMKLTEEAGVLNIELFRLGGMKDGEYERLNAMVSEPEFGLYTESRELEAPYFGAKLEPQSGVYAGMNGDGMVPRGQLSATLNYLEFDTYQTEVYRINSTYIEDMDCLCIVPWNITDLSLVYDNDEYMRYTLDKLKAFGKPMIIRFGAEMNVSQIGDMPAAYVNAFRKVSELIHAEYPEFAVMWSINDLGGLNKPTAYYYPGDEYVDWIGVSSFMKKHFMAQTGADRATDVYFMTGDFAYHTNALKNVTQFMRENGIQKPLAISEGGTATSLNYENGGEIDEWSQRRMENMYWYVPMRYPEVKLIDYFNRSTSSEAQSYDISSKKELVDIFEEATTAGMYRKSYSEGAEFTFVNAVGRTYQAEDMIPLYTFAYVPEEDVSRVAYSIDGALLAECTEVPYRYEMDISELAEGDHLLSIDVTAGDMVFQQSHMVNKTGNEVNITEAQ